MSSEDLGTTDEGGAERASRPVIFPTVVIPLHVLFLTAGALLGAATLAMVAALIKALAYSTATPPGVSGVDVSQPTLSLADRLSIFTSGGAGTVVAIFIALAVALATIADRNDNRIDRIGSAILVASSLAAAVIIALNAIMIVDVLANTPGIFLENETANKASSAISHLEPILLAVGVIGYSASRLRADWDATAADQPVEEPERG